MTTKQHLYLIGGDPNMYDVNEDFIRNAGGEKARIALLFANSEGWENFLSLYTDTFKAIGIQEYTLVMPSKDGQELTSNDIEVIRNATGIFIGGGVPELYYRAYVENASAKKAIKEQFEKGVPVAACSAGALILPKETYLLPMEADDYTLVEGMGLIDNIVIGVHYTEFNQKKNVKEVMNHYNLSSAYGIDEDSCAYFQNGKYKKTFGKKVHIVIPFL